MKLNKMIQEIVDVTNKKYPDMSSRFKEMTDLTLRDKSRLVCLLCTVVSFE